MKFLLVVAALLVSTLLVDAGRRHSNRGEGRRGRHRGPEGARYVWSRDLGDGNTVEESALVPTDRQQVYLKSTDDSLTAAGFTKSLILYDFTVTTPRLSISLLDRGRNSPCYVADTTLTYQGAIDILTARNGTVTSLGTEVSLDGSSPPVHSTRRICKTGRTVSTSVTAVEGSGTTEEVRVLALDNVVNLRVPLATESGRGNGRRGRPGRTGRGRNQPNEE